MSKKQQAVIILGAALAGQAYLGKVAKQQAAALGVSALVMGLAALAMGTVLG